MIEKPVCRGKKSSYPSVFLVHGNDVGVVSIEGVWPKFFAHNYLLKDPP